MWEQHLHLVVRSDISSSRRICFRSEALARHKWEALEGVERVGKHVHPAKVCAKTCESATEEITFRE